MTSPERFRRRQRVEGAFLVMLAVITIAYGVLDSTRSEARDACIAKAFAQANDVQNERADLAESSTALQQRIDDVQNTVIQDVAASTTEKDVVAAFERFNSTLDIVMADQRVLLIQRQKTQIPDFPTGKCD